MRRVRHARRRRSAARPARRARPSPSHRPQRGALSPQSLGSLWSVRRARCPSGRRPVSGWNGRRWEDPAGRRPDRRAGRIHPRVDRQPAAGRPGKDPAGSSSAASRRRTRGTRGSRSPVSWCGGGRSHWRGAAPGAPRERHARRGAGPGPFQGAGLPRSRRACCAATTCCSTRPVSGARVGIATPTDATAARSTSTWSPRSSRWHGGSAAPRRRHWRPWLLASAAATGVILIAYATDVTGPAAAILQRAADDPAEVAVAAIAARLTWRAGRAGPEATASG